MNAKVITSLLVCLSMFSTTQYLVGKTQGQKADLVGSSTKQIEDSQSTTDYDPLTVTEEEIVTLELKVNDAAREREFPVLVYLPTTKKATAVIVHSHGLGGQKETSSFLGKHWAGRGYVAVFLQHPGSDVGVWENVPRLKRFAALRKAASWENLKLRVGDVSSAIDQLGKWNATEGHSLFGRLDLERIGMSGHSYGAVTTQNVSGQRNVGLKADPRIRAAIPMSPSMPRTRNPERTFARVSVPWLCMTGTHDEALIGNATAESRRQVFESLPEGNKYELVLSNAEHFVFTESSLHFGRGKPPERNPNHHPAIKAISTAFWDAYLLEDETARGWIGSESVRDVLESDDVWQTK